MSERSADWFRQGEADLRHARNAAAAGDYEWAAFAAQQAAEKAISTRSRKRSGRSRRWGRFLRSVVVKSVDERAVRRAMDAYASRLFDEHAGIEEVVVFGSFETGTWAPGSDLDVFIVLSHSDRPLPERVADLLPGAFPVGIDLFPFTRDEMAARTPSPLLDAVRASRWRYRRPEQGPGS